MKWVNNTVEKVPVLWKSGSISTLLLYDKATDCRFLFPSTSPVHGEDFFPSNFKRLGKVNIQGISYLDGPFKLTLADRNIQVIFC